LDEPPRANFRDARNYRQLATSNEKPGFARLFHFLLYGNLPVLFL
jgi:hypothetical protein